ncbi:leucyl aminopeptidase [Thermoproteota archaeon]
MDITIDSDNILKKKYDIISLGIFQDKKINGISKIIDNAIDQEISITLKNTAFIGKLKQTYLITTNGKIGIKRILLVGLGKYEDFCLENIRVASAKAAISIRNLGISSCFFDIFGNVNKISLDKIVENIVIGIELALYKFDRYKTDNLESKTIDNVTIYVEKPEFINKTKTSISSGQIISRGVNLARNLSNTPSSDATPSQIAEEAEKIASENNMTYSILNIEDMKNLGMGGMINVSRGSEQPPKFVILKYSGGGKSKPIVLVGKGITFDSGGISLKPADKMEEMKHDKAGAATVIATMQTVAQLKLPLNIIGISPLTENLPSGSAYKPGDVLKMSNGKTVEIINTDAEGRLILADALAYTSKYNPQAVIDLATLTGACIIALGNFTTGLLGNNDDLKQKITLSGENTGERVWELPLWDNYKELLKSDIADMKNVGGRPGGVITAASFLSYFVNYPWVHLDIAGTAWTNDDGMIKPYNPKGATGVGVRLIVDLLRSWKS